MKARKGFLVPLIGVIIYLFNIIKLVLLITKLRFES